MTDGIDRHKPRHISDLRFEQFPLGPSQKSPRSGPSAMAQKASQKVCHLLPTSAILVEFVPENLFRAGRPAVPSPERRRFVTHTISPGSQS